MPHLVCSYDNQAGDYRLLPASPAIDVGNNAYITATLDLAGGLRFLDVPSAPDTGEGTPPLVDLGAYEANWVHQVFFPIVQQKFTP